MGKIDDTIDASFEAFPEESEGLGKRFGELALGFSGLVFGPAAVLKVFTDQFLPTNRFSRIEYLLQVLKVGLKQLESQLDADREKMKKIQSRIDTVKFQEGVAAACEESARASNGKKVERMAAVLTGSLEPSQWADPNVDLATMIRDVAQLGEQDILVLGLLRIAFRVLISHLPNLNDPNQFTERIDDYRTTIRINALEPELFYGVCARLSGFGLALEVLRNTSRMHPHEYLFRPTRRGLALLDSLDKFGSASEALQ